MRAEYSFLSSKTTTSNDILMAGFNLKDYENNTI
jgi:hypothetical protein